MKIVCYPDTDSMYMDLSDNAGVETREVSPGAVPDYDIDGNLVGIDIDNASKKLSLKKLILRRIPTDSYIPAAAA